MYLRYMQGWTAMNGFVAVTAGRGCGCGTDKGSTRRGAARRIHLGWTTKNQGMYVLYLGACRVFCRVLLGRRRSFLHEG